MPEELRKNKDGSYSVVNAKTGKVHSKHTTKQKGEAQIRIIEQADAKKHGRKK